MPEAVDVLGGGPGKGGTAIARELPRTSGMKAAPQQTALVLESLLVNLAVDSGTDLFIQKKPIGPDLRVRQFFPQRLAEAQQQLHRYVRAHPATDSPLRAYG